MGTRRTFYDARGRVAGSIAALIAARGDNTFQLDALGIRKAWGDPAARYCDRTWVAGICSVPPGHRVAFAQGQRSIAAIARENPPLAPLPEIVRAAVARLLGRGRAALWLSSGLDSCLLLALLAELGFAGPVYVLSPIGQPSHDEWPIAAAMAKRFGYSAIRVPFAGDTLIDALPDALYAAETPLYDLHPVGKYVLAQRTARDGFDVALTGDGADQLFAHDDTDDYLPIVCSMAAAAGVEIRSPFFDPALCAWQMARRADHTKAALRTVATPLLGEAFAHQEKIARFAPPFAIDRAADTAHLASIAAAIDLPLALDSHRARVGWTSLALLHRRFTDEPCAQSLAI